MVTTSSGKIVWPPRNLGAAEGWGRTVEKSIQEVTTQLDREISANGNRNRQNAATADRISDQLLQLETLVGEVRRQQELNSVNSSSIQVPFPTRTAVGESPWADYTIEYPFSSSAVGVVTFSVVPDISVASGTAVVTKALLTLSLDLPEGISKIVSNDSVSGGAGQQDLNDVTLSLSTSTGPLPTSVGLLTNFISRTGSGDLSITGTLMVTFNMTSI